MRWLDLLPQVSILGFFHECLQRLHQVGHADCVVCNQPRFAAQHDAKQVETMLDGCNMSLFVVTSCCIVLLCLVHSALHLQCIYCFNTQSSLSTIEFLQIYIYIFIYIYACVLAGAISTLRNTNGKCESIVVRSAFVKPQPF